MIFNLLLSSKPLSQRFLYWWFG